MEEAELLDRGGGKSLENSWSDVRGINREESGDERKRKEMKLRHADE